MHIYIIDHLIPFPFLYVQCVTHYVQRTVSFPTSHKYFFCFLSVLSLYFFSILLQYLHFMMWHCDRLFDWQFLFHFYFLLSNCLSVIFISFITMRRINISNKYISTMQSNKKTVLSSSSFGFCFAYNLCFSKAILIEWCE